MIIEMLSITSESGAYELQFTKVADNFVRIVIVDSQEQQIKGVVIRNDELKRVVENLAL